MRTRLLILVFLGLINCAGTRNVKVRSVAIVQGFDSFYLVDVPQGWSLADQTSSFLNKVDIIMYPANTYFSGSEVNIYFRLIAKDTTLSTLEDHIGFSLAQYQNLYGQTSRVTHFKDFLTADSSQAKTYFFQNELDQDFVAVAYVIEDRYVSRIILSAHTKEQFVGALDTFSKVIATYKFFDESLEDYLGNRKNDVPGM